jgi:hypothetical protein
MRKRNILIGTAVVALVGGLAVLQSTLEQVASAQAQGKPMAPYFEVDPTWPKPLPDGMYQGQTIGLWVDSNDHIWAVHRPDVLDALEGAGDQKTGECCKIAPPILEFDMNGTLLRRWGGEDGPNGQWTWPASNHGLNTDNKGNIWIGGNGGSDGHMLKFTQDGKFVMQVGKSGVTRNSQAKDHFFQVADMFFHQPTNEVFVADGYGNKRVAVIDNDTGVMKRFWGAYGKPPDDAAALAQGAYDEKTTYQQYRGPVHCADVSKDGFVYVCDRGSDRVQVFRIDGTFVQEVYIQRDTRGDGATWDTAFSPDPQQQFLYVADGRNQKIHIFDRKSMTELTSFGKGGHYPGEWYSLHNVATDSKGNLYTAETYEGRRVQRFLYKGMRPVTSPRQGVVFPTGQ